MGTDKNSAEEISKAFYNIACSYRLSVGTEEATISLSGLQENFEKATKMLEDLLANCKPNEKALEDLKGRILKDRENDKLNKGAILSGLMSYAEYGSDNPFNYALSNQEIKNIKANDLIYILHNLTNYEHKITYYGPKALADFSAEIKNLHPLGKAFTPAASRKKFVYTKTDSNKVYFANYDMVQAEIRWERNAGLYNAEEAAKTDLFNNYFGSVVFQVIRESKALAYSTYAVYSTPDKRDKENLIVAYVGAQADKMNEAITGMNELLDTLPLSDKNFNLSKNNALNSLETSRITKDDIIDKYLADKKLGFDNDSRIDEYKALKPLTFEDLKTFHQDEISNKPYNYCIVASDKKINIADLKNYGLVSKLSLEQIFGY